MKNFNVVKNQKIAFIIVAVVLVVGIASFLIRGFNIDIDFSGGTEIQVNLGREVTQDICDEINEIIASHEQLGQNYVSSTTQSGADANVAIIRTGSSELTNEQQDALISALEGALRTGMGYHWSDEVLSDLLNKVGEQPDIVSLVITNRNGTVLMAADTKLIGTSFLSPEVLAELDPTRQVKWNATELPDGMPVFQVYKQFSVPQGERRRHGGGHRMMRRGLDGDSCGMLEASIAEGTSLVIFVEYDLTPLEEAQAADEKHMAVMFGILVFVGLVGCITLFLIQSYRRSRKLVQETTAFSSEILRTLPVGIISTDMDDRITSINPAAQDITGLTRTAATGRGLHDLLPGVWAVLEGRTAQDAAREQEAWCTVGERRVPLAISASHIVTEVAKPSARL